MTDSLSNLKVSDVKNAIATYVFFDTETTGLPEPENYQTKITEICFLAVKRKHFLQTKKGREPRVQQKITLCLNPERELQRGAAEVSDLSNDLLEQEPCFDTEVFTIIKTFFSLLTKPICLIAHNGHNFDYPILKYLLDTLGVNLPEDLMCADSIYGFFDILEERKNNGGESLGPNTSSDNNHNNENASKAKRMKITQKKSAPVFLQEARIRLLPYSRARRATYWTWRGEKKPDQSYALKHIYYRLLNHAPANAHSAEGDCLMMLKCSLELGEAFVQWVDWNHCLFSEVTPMRPGHGI